MSLTQAQIAAIDRAAKIATAQHYFCGTDTQDEAVKCYDEHALSYVFDDGVANLWEVYAPYEHLEHEDLCEAVVEYHDYLVATFTEALEAAQ